MMMRRFFASIFFRLWSSNEMPAPNMETGDPNKRNRPEKFRPACQSEGGYLSIYFALIFLFVSNSARINFSKSVPLIQIGAKP